MCRVPTKLEDGMLCGTMHKKVADWRCGSMLIHVYPSIKHKCNYNFKQNSEYIPLNKGV